MNILNFVEELQISQLESFTKKAETSWGYFFCDENNPNYYDANHAHVKNVPSNVHMVIDEVIAFYEGKKLIPRFYIYNIDNQTELIKELKERCFGFEQFVDPIQLWNNILIENTVDNNITIEKVTEENFNDALAIRGNISELGGKEVGEQAFKDEFKHSSYTHYLLRYNNIPCATACMYIYKNQACLEMVATLSEFRGKGLIGRLIRYIQKEVRSKGIDKLWVFPINEKVEKVYEKYGFETIGSMKTGHAFLGGQSINEIRGD